MLFDAIFLTLFFLTWLLLGSLPWVALSLRRRARGALWALPFALLGGAAGGVIVPAVGLDNGLGVGISVLGAVLGGWALTWAAYRAWDDYDIGRHFARWGPASPANAAGPELASSEPAGSEAASPEAPSPEANAPEQFPAGEQPDAPLDSNPGTTPDPGAK